MVYALMRQDTLLLDCLDEEEMSSTFDMCSSNKRTARLIPALDFELKAAACSKIEAWTAGQQAAALVGTCKPECSVRLLHAVPAWQVQTLKNHCVCASKCKPKVGTVGEQEAAGVFGYMRDTAALRVEHPRPVDISPECAGMLERLCLAQSQECSYEKFCTDRKDAKTLAK